MAYGGNRLADREQDMANLATIPGIGHLGAKITLAEAGGAMARFPRSVRARLEPSL
ncbi:hypothetical protein [Streptomyces sp. NPDC057889]|uniref:hypothetical protein n=1 Tax=unclassified Streptomyces TaxID=2593676 RepID=UPI0036C80F3C